MFLSALDQSTTRRRKRRPPRSVSGLRKKQVFPYPRADGGLSLDNHCSWHVTVFDCVKKYQRATGCLLFTALQKKTSNVFESALSLASTRRTLGLAVDTRRDVCEQIIRLRDDSRKNPNNVFFATLRDDSDVR